MQTLPSRSAAARRPGMQFGTAFGVAAAILFFLITGTLAYSNIQGLRQDSAKVVHTHEVITSLGNLLSAVQDAETGQRGFLLTGNERYLQPYEDALARTGAGLDAIGTLTHDNEVQQANLRSLRPHVDAKLTELRETIALRRSQGADAAQALVGTDQGKREMDAIRAQVDAMRAEEKRLREARLAQMESSYQTATLSGFLAALVGIGLTLAVGALINRTAVARQRLAWLQAGEVGLAQAMLGDKTVRELADSILDFLSGYLGAQASVLF
ncbi:MAG: histidine kinase, partial [Sphingomonadales bacterium]